MGTEYTNKPFKSLQGSGVPRCLPLKMHIGTCLSLLNYWTELRKLRARSVMVPCTFTVLAVIWWNFIFRCIVILFFRNLTPLENYYAALQNSEKQLRVFFFCLICLHWLVVLGFFWVFLFCIFFCEVQHHSMRHLKK